MINTSFASRFADRSARCSDAARQHLLCYSLRSSLSLSLTPLLTLTQTFCSLLEVKDGDTFLDLAAKQILDMRSKHGAVKFMLMNSFSTSDDTMEFLGKKYPSLVAEGGIEFVQNKVPKVREASARGAKG